MEQDPQSLTAPPRFELEGIDLVTEGAVTLNQVYNVIDEPLEKLTEDSGVTELCTFLQLADRVNIFLGGAHNRAHGDISFRQQGILTRDRIVPLIADKLARRASWSCWSRFEWNRSGPDSSGFSTARSAIPAPAASSSKETYGIIQINPIEYITS